METGAIHEDNNYSSIQKYITFASNFLDNTLPRIGLGTIDDEVRITLLPQIVCLCAGSYEDGLPIVNIPIGKDVNQIISQNCFDPTVWKYINMSDCNQLFATKLGDIGFEESNITLVIKRSTEPQNIPHKMWLTSFIDPILYENYQQRLLESRHNRVMNTLYASMKSIVASNSVTQFDQSSLKDRQDIKDILHYHDLNSVSDLVDLLRENSRNAGANQCLINARKLEIAVRNELPTSNTQILVGTHLNYFEDYDNHFALLLNAFNKWYIASPSHMLNPKDLRFPEDSLTGEVINRLKYIWIGNSEEEVLSKYMAVEGGSWRYF